MNAITIEGISKKFKKVSLTRGYKTFKDIFTFAGRAAPENNGNGKDDFTALKNVDFEIPKGETWGLIGRNGSGKSTLLKLIAGIYKPDEGNIVIDGRVSALIELGAGFHPEFSGRENVFINASILGMSKKRISEIFDDIVKFAELEEFIDNPVRTYSSGMFMRLGFSVAIHVDPDILLVDEVLAVGDESFGAKCRERMEDFKKAGKTIVLVTHNLSEVEKWCDAAVWLDHGEIKSIGKPGRVVDSYLAEVAKTDNEGRLENDKESAESVTEELNRWGDKVVTIEKVTINGHDGMERKVFSTGDQVRVKIDYIAHKRVVDPVIGIGIHKGDGLHLYGANTDIEKIEIPFMDGNGSAEILFDNMNLVDGAYTFSVAIHAKDGHSYDYHDQVYSFSVRSKIKDVGSFRPPHRWIVNGQETSPTLEID